METNKHVNSGDGDIESNEQYKKAIEESIKNDHYIFLRAHANWCGHCKLLVPEWKQLLQHVRSDNKLNGQIKLISIDSDNLDNISSLKEKVRGFPTIFFIKNGNFDNAEKYGETPQQPRTYDSMLKFITDKINSKPDSKTIRKTKSKPDSKTIKKTKSKSNVMSGGGKIKGIKTNRRRSKRSKSGSSLRKRSKSRADRGKSRSKSRSRN